METLTRRITNMPVTNEARGAEESDYNHARQRVEFGIEQLQKLGAEVDGEVGNANPAKAVESVERFLTGRNVFSGWWTNGTRESEQKK